MHMTPQHATDVRVVADDGEKLVGVLQPHGIEPATAHLDRVMVQADQNVMIPVGIQYSGQMGQLRRSNATAGAMFNPRVEHDDQPASELGLAADPEWRGREFGPHVIRKIMVAGEALPSATSLCISASGCSLSPTS